MKLKKHREDNPGEYGFTYKFITRSKLGPTQKLVLVEMMSDFDMNGQIRWTRQKYKDETGSSYPGVCDVFNFLLLNKVLKPIDGTSNYSLDFGLLQRKCESNNWVKLPKHQKKTNTEYSKTNTEYSTSNTEYTESNTEYSKSNTEYQHIDNIDLKDNKDLYKEGEDVFKTSSPSAQQVAAWASSLD